jgi:hypothetical protein
MKTRGHHTKPKSLVASPARLHWTVGALGDPARATAWPELASGPRYHAAAVGRWFHRSQSAARRSEWQRGLSLARIGLHRLQPSIVASGRALPAWGPIPLQSLEPCLPGRGVCADARTSPGSRGWTCRHR